MSLNNNNFVGILYPHLRTVNLAEDSPTNAQVITQALKNISDILHASQIDEEVTESLFDFTKRLVGKLAYLMVSTSPMVSFAASDLVIQLVSILKLRFSDFSHIVYPSIVRGLRMKDFLSKKQALDSACALLEFVATPELVALICDALVGNPSTPSTQELSPFYFMLKYMPETAIFFSKSNIENVLILGLSHPLPEFHLRAFDCTKSYMLRFPQWCPSFFDRIPSYLKTKTGFLDPFELPTQNPFLNPTSPTVSKPVLSPSRLTGPKYPLETLDKPFVYCPFSKTKSEIPTFHISLKRPFSAGPSENTVVCQDEHPTQNPYFVTSISTWSRAGYIETWANNLFALNPSLRPTPVVYSYKRLKLSTLPDLS